MAHCCVPCHWDICLQEPATANGFDYTFLCGEGGILTGSGFCKQQEGNGRERNEPSPTLVVVGAFRNRTFEWVEYAADDHAKDTILGQFRAELAADNINLHGTGRLGQSGFSGTGTSLKFTGMANFRPREAVEGVTNQREPN